MSNEQENADVTTTGDPIDVEFYATKNERAPDGPRYRIRVDKTVYVVEGPLVKGRTILEVSGHVPVAHWRLDQRFRGGVTRKVELDERIDLRAPGLERFMTLPLDQTEGAEPERAPSE